MAHNHILFFVQGPIGPTGPKGELGLPGRPVCIMFSSGIKIEKLLLTHTKLLLLILGPPRTEWTERCER